MLVDELKKCGETLVRISEELADLFSSGKDAMQPVKKTAVKKKTNEEPKAEVPEEKALTLEDVRAVCADKSHKGYTAEVKAILTTDDAISERKTYSEEQKNFFVDYGLTIVKVIHSLLE